MVFLGIDQRVPVAGDATLTYAFYPLCFILLPLRWAIGAAIGLGMASMAMLEGGLGELLDTGALAAVAGSTLLAVTIGLFIQAIARQSARRAEVIDELDALSRTSAALVAARTPADVIAALGTHLGLDRAALLDRSDEETQVVTAWSRPGVDPLPDAVALPGPDALVVAVTTSSGAGTALLLEPAEGEVSSWRTAAAQAGLALDNLRLVERARTAGMLEERQRLAREMHDTLAQGFTSIVLQLEAAEQALPATAEAVGQHLDLARRTARESLAEVRRSVQALRPEPLDQATLPEAITRVTAAWSAEAGVPAGTTTTGTPRPLHPDVEVTLLRVAQEGLANARKHARPRRVAVTLSYMDDLAMLDVRDDGRGFDPGGRKGDGGLSGGFGLRALRERLAGLGGELAIETDPGQGTALVATVPLARETP